MEKTNYQVVLDTVEPFLKENGFEFNQGEVEYYSKENKAFQIEYDEQSQLLKLRTAALEEGQDVVWADLSSWLFTEQSDKRDLTNIANDFLDTLKSKLDVKVTAVKVSLPTKSAKGSTMSVDAFTARFLDFFASLKPEYKEYVAQYGEFLYDNFYRTTARDAVLNMLDSGTKKQISKFFAFLGESYVDGDVSVKSIVVYNLLCGIYFSKPEMKDKTEEYLEKNVYLKTAVNSMMSILKTQKSRAKYLAD